MAIKDSIRDAGVAESQNYALVEILLTTAASGTAWSVAAASQSAASKVHVVENAAIGAAKLQQIMTGANGVLSSSASTKATNLNTYFAASATDINFAVGGLAGLSASSVLSAEVEIFDANGVKYGALVAGPADKVLTATDLTVSAGDLILDAETGTIVGKIGIGTLTVSAAVPAVLKLRVKF